MHTCALRRFISKCGAVPGMWLKYAPNLKSMLPALNNRTVDDIRSCLWREGRSLDCQCQVGCQQVSFKQKQITEPTALWHTLAFEYISNTYTEITEIPAYPATKFVTDIGGWLGLFSGMSLLSIVEVLLSVILTLIAILHKFKHVLLTRYRHTRNLSPA